MMTNTQKDWRKEKRLARKTLSAPEQISHSAKIAKTVLATDEYRQAQKVAAYLCMPEEVDVKEIIKVAWADGKSVYLPVVVAQGKPLLFAPYRPNTNLIKDVLDIEIPDVPINEYVDAELLDVVVTPLVAFDEQCNRIGMGGGFYDRTFAFKKKGNATPTLIGVAFETQKIDGKIDINEWDVRTDSIVTEVKAY